MLGIFGGGHTITYHHKWEASGLDQWGNESGVDRIFVDHPCYKRPGMYGEWGKDYADNLFRFTLFAWAGTSHVGSDCSCKFLVLCELFSETES